MEKHLKRKGFPKRIKERADKAPKPDLARLIMGLGEHLVVLEGKMNTLLNRIGDRPGEARNFAEPRRHDEVRRENNFRERVLHKAICAECNKECEVPFRPTGDRPVYCKDCFSKRKSSQPFGAGRNEKVYERKKPARFEARKGSYKRRKKS